MERSFWQKEAQAAGHGFDAFGRKLDMAKAEVLRSSSSSSSVSAPAPTYYDVEYAPAHPDADWSGLVKKKPERHHFPLVQQSKLAPHPLGGLTGREESQKRPGGGVRTRGAPPASTSLLIGGPMLRAAADDGQWTTSYHAQSTGMPTPTEHSDPLRLTKTTKTVPAEAKQEDEHKETQRATPRPAPLHDHADTLIGYRAPQGFRSGKASFLVGIGKKLQQSSEDTK